MCKKMPQWNNHAKSVFIYMNKLSYIFQERMAFPLDTQSDLRVMINICGGSEWRVAIRAGPRLSPKVKADQVQL